MTKENLSSKPSPDTQTGPRDEVGAVIYPNPPAGDMRFTEPTRSEAAQGVEDPDQVIVRATGSGLAAATKAERNRREP